jgi:peroxiredoxin
MTPDNTQPPPRPPLAAGAQAPEFDFVIPGGGVLRSASILANGPALLTFYRGAWCPCCQTDLLDLKEAMLNFRSKTGSILGVFHQLGEDGGPRITHKFDLNFPIVDDHDGHVAESFGLRLTKREIDALEAQFGEVPRTLSEGTAWITPMQARYVIGPDGLIVHSEVIYDYNERTDAIDLLEMLARVH